MKAGPEEQLDLFSAGGFVAEQQAAVARAGTALEAAALDDASLVAAIPNARLKDARALAAEAGRRRSASAVPALEALCRRFAGFGRESPIPEQLAALAALAAIGGAASARAVVALIEAQVVEGPNRVRAIAVAARLGARLPGPRLIELMADTEPLVRAAACALVGQQLALVPRLLELLTDAVPEVRTAAACALGHMGRREALPALSRYLRDAPSEPVIEALATIADEDCVILLARIARLRPDLAEAARDALSVIDHPRARQLRAGLPATSDG